MDDWVLIKEQLIVNFNTAFITILSPASLVFWAAGSCIIFSWVHRVGAG